MSLTNIPVAKPDLTLAEEEAAARVLRSGWLTQGPVTIDFEKKLAEYFGAKKVFCVSSCTTGLLLAYKAAGIGHGDEVIVPSYSFIASANSVVHAGATPVFADISLRDYNLDIESVKDAITPKTKAILLVHQVGTPADIAPFAKLARERGLLIIEDAACAIGTVYQGKLIGSHSDFVVFSFHPRKILTTGEGGAVAYNGSDPKILQYLEIGRKHGMSVNDLERHLATKVIFESYPLIGYNFRLTDIQSAVGIVQLQRLEGMLKARRAVALQFFEAFHGKNGLLPPVEPGYGKMNFQSFLLRLTGEAKISRDELMTRLLEEGIASRRGIMMAHAEPCYAGQENTRRVPLTNTEIAGRDTLVLPLYNQMTQQEISRVISSVLKYV